jgi:cation diffusion facilitator CzcD-associated flavoprotein CzcO
MAKRPKLMEVPEQWAVEYIEQCIDDPELRKKLTPNYSMGCKRILMSNEYYQTLARPDVDLVTDTIREITPRGIVTKDGKEHELDVLIFATGFKVGDAGAPFELVGCGGASLDARWKDGPEAYLGATVPGFPNYFLVAGPNTGLSHTSMIFMLESAMSYALDAIEKMRARGIAHVDVRPEVCARYNDEIQARLDGTVWSSGCKSWYLAPNGKNVSIWPSFTFEYRRRTQRFDLESYTVVEKRGSTSVRKPRAGTPVREAPGVSTPPRAASPPTTPPEPSAVSLDMP